MTPDAILDGLAKIQAAGRSKPVTARDPVNLPMIHNWVEAIGDANPIYVDEAAARSAGYPGLVAPPAMIQVWTMRGLYDRHAPDDPLGLAMGLMDEAGFTAVVATNCEQAYHRYLRLGEQVAMVTQLDGVSGPKQTALGVGWFITTRHTWYSDGEEVASMRFRMLKYVAPAAGVPVARSAKAEEPRVATLPREQLPALTIEASPTFIISSALATRDFQDVHHDRDRAVAHGSKDIFVNILTDTGLVQRFATDWAGPSAHVREVSLRLLAPCYAYDTLVFSADATGTDGDVSVSVTADGQLGRHLAGSVRLTR
jgi:acyl dehydratase